MRLVPDQGPVEQLATAGLHPALHDLRQALFAWAFNPATRDTTPPPQIAAALDWAETRLAPGHRAWKTPRPCGWRWPPAPGPWPASRRPGRPSGASGRCSTTPSATPSNSATSPPTRSTGSSGPPPPSPQSVDRRVVVSPAQAGTLLAAVRAARAAGRAPGGVLRLPLLRRAAPVGGGHAPRGRPAPAQDRVGTDRPGRLRLPGRAGLDRRRHRPAGTRPEAPRRQRDPHHPHPARPGPAAPRPHQAVRHDPGRADLPDRPGRHLPGLRLQRGLGPRPARRRSPPPSTGPRSAAAPTTCGTRRCRCG